VDIYEHISQMKPFIASHDWEGLERVYRTLATQLAGAQRAARIAALDFASYQSRLRPFVVDLVRKQTFFDPTPSCLGNVRRVHLG
jgi:hypothetical protein